jgi:hypothetical protein
MGYKEQVEGWELSITGVDLGGIYSGSGTRVFVGSPASDCNTTLPSIGDAMVDPEPDTAVSYPGIVCVEKRFQRTHSTDANGLTCTVTYNSLDKPDTNQQKVDNASGTFSADIVTLNVQGGTSWFWYTDNTVDGATTTFPIDTLGVDNGGPCSENLPLTVMQIQRTKRITFSSDAALEAWMPKVSVYGGKINDTAMLGFAKGQVLLGAISGSMNNGEWEIDVTFICRKVTDPSITQDDWNYMPSTSEGAVLYHRPVKGTPVISDGAGFVDAVGEAYMYGYADISAILDTSAYSTP